MKVIGYLLAGAVACCACGSRAADKYIAVVNSAFEQRTTEGRAVGWDHGTNFTARGGEGQNGSGGLVWEAKTPTTRQQGVVQNVKGLEQGIGYQFSFFVRTENFKGAVCGCIEWYDKDDKWLAGGYTSSLTAENADWQILQNETRPIPKNAVRFQFQIYIGAGATGRVSLDNVSIVAITRAPIDFVRSSRYRAMAESGDVTFNAALNLQKVEEKAPGSCRARFAYVGADGARVTRKADVFAPDKAALTLPVAALAKGAHPVACEVWQGERKLGEASCSFARVDALPKRRISFDAHNRCLVDGKPFFPNGMYWGAVEPDKLDVYATGPFNCLMPYGTTTIEQLDWCHAKGLMAFLDIRHLATQPEDTMKKLIAEKLPPYKAHPALLGWYANDEAPLTEVPARTRLYKALVDFDADHPVFAVLDHTYRLRGFLPSYDVLGVDPYPVSDQPVSRVTAFVNATREATFDSCPLWNVPQGFNWGWYRPQLADKYRFPTLEEYRSMCWQHIAGGANGLITYCFYRYWDANDPQKKPQHRNYRENHWRTVCTVGAEVRRMIDVMLSVEPVPAVTGVALPHRVWVKDGAVYLLAVNPETAACTFTAHVAGGFESAVVELGTAPKQTQDGAVTCDLPPLGMTFLRLAR